MRKRKTLWIVFLIVLADMLGVGILIPIIPLMFGDPSYPYHLNLDPHVGYLLLGALTALYPLTTFLFVPILGQLSDTFGRKPILAFSLLGTAISYVLFAFGIIFRNIPLLFAARALDGATGGNVAVALAVVADSTTAEDRVWSFGIISAANGVGFILGPLVGVVLSDPHILPFFGAPTPFWFAAILSGLNMLAVLLFLPETLKHKVKEYIRPWQAFQYIKEAAIGKARRSLYMTSFLYQSGFAFIITFFGVYLISRFGFEQEYIGYIFAFVGLLLALTQILITGPLSKQAKPPTIIFYSLLVMSASVLGLYFVQNAAFLYLLTVPTAISAGLIIANLSGLISTSSDEDQQGSTLAINSSVQALAQAIPPIFAVFFYITNRPKLVP